MELWNGEAFHALKKAEKLILLECVSQLRYAPKSVKKRANFAASSLFECSLGHLLNKGEFGLPTKYLQERGIKSEETISRAKKRLVELGFMDVVDQGSFAKAGRFRYSDRWRLYNAGELFKEKGAPLYDGPLPGYCHYKNILKFNETRAQQSSASASNGNQNGEFIQLDLFPDLFQTDQP